MKNSLVVRWGLGAALACALVPFNVRAQTAPAPAPPPPTAAPTVEPTVVPAPEATAPAVTPATTPPYEAMSTAAEVTPPPAEAPAEAASAPVIPAPTITGYVEASYHINFSDIKGLTPINMRVYDPPGNSFALHAAHLAITEKFTDEISAVIEIDMGRDAAATSGATVYPWGHTPQFGFDIQEAYANYASGMWTLSAGKFVTYEGIEVIEGPLNPTITRGYLFGYAEPFTHTGVKLHLAPSPVINIGVGVVNGWDLIADNNSGKTVIGRVALFAPTDPFFAALSGSVGPEQEGVNKNQRISVDLTGAITAGAFQLWYQANVGTEKNPVVPMGAAAISSDTWYGFGLQPVITADSFSFGGRIEFFADNHGARTGLGKGSYLNVTLTPGIKLADVFKLRAELRMDTVLSGDAVFGKATDPKKVGFSGALSAEYTF
jgi:hypothetical protein